MPNPPLPLPATTIQAAWGQAVTTRVVNVYQNAAARDAAIPTPDDGQMAYLIDEDVLTVRIAGVLWGTLGVGTFVQVQGDTMDGDLTLNNADILIRNGVLTVQSTGTGIPRLLLAGETDGNADIFVQNTLNSPFLRLQLGIDDASMRLMEQGGVAIAWEVDHGWPNTTTHLSSVTKSWVDSQALATGDTLATVEIPRHSTEVGGDPARSGRRRSR